MGQLILGIFVCITSLIMVKVHMEYDSSVGTALCYFFIFAVFLTLTLSTLYDVHNSKNDTELKNEYAILVETLNSYNEDTAFEIELVERVQKFNENYLEYVENVENENFWTKGFYSKEAIEGLNVICIEDYLE